MRLNFENFYTQKQIKLYNENKNSITHPVCLNFLSDRRVICVINRKIIFQFFFSKLLSRV